MGARVANRHLNEFTHQIEPVIDILIQEIETRTAPNSSCGMIPHAEKKVFGFNILYSLISMNVIMYIHICRHIL